jgi:hypothetical protein
MRQRSALGWLLGLMLSLTGAGGAVAQTDPLPSWNDSPVKQRLVKFVQTVTDAASSQHVPPAARIAVFDNDGTLWSEQPNYFQGIFAFDRVKALAPKHPEWKTKQPFKGILENDMKAVAAAGEKGLFEVIAATYAGMTTDEFAQTVRDWVAQARHPRFQRPYTDLVYQPMLELLAYLRANGFSVYNAEGYFEKNQYDAYTLNNITAKKDADGSIAVQFGGCDGRIPNCIPIVKGWNYTVRLYRLRAEILSGKWRFPHPQPAQ